MQEQSLVLYGNKHINIRKYLPRITLGITIGILVSLLVNVVIIQGWAGLGGFASEKRVDRAGVANSSVVVSRTGEGSPSLVGLGPIVTTGAVSNQTPAAVTLNGTIDDLNGFGLVNVWFEWWQALPANTSTIATTTVTGQVGIIIDISTIDPTLPVYYRIVGNADGSLYGATESFNISGATGETTGTNIMSIILPLGIIAGMIVALVVNIKKPVTMAMVLAVGILAYILATYVIDALW